MNLMGVYHKNSAIASEVREKRNILRDRYGGMMTLVDLMEELGYKSEKSAMRAALEMSLPQTKVGRSKKFDTDTVARRLVELRGVC